MKNPKKRIPEPNSSQFPTLNSPLVLVWAVLGVAIYLFLFFATPFEPYTNLGESVSRAYFFLFLLLPDDYFGPWFGPDGVFSLVDRIPIMLLTFLCLSAATGIGNVFMIPARRRTRIGKLEYWLFSTVIGLGFVSMALFWFYFFHPGFGTPPRGFFAVTLVFGGICCLGICHFVSTNEPEPAVPTLMRSPFSIFWPVLPLFGLLLLLGGMIPSTDYDMLSYHLAGTRTFYQSGRIAFVPNDVYANMPFGAEMFYLWGMSLTGDVFSGALVGKTIIASTTLLTALGVYAFGRRFFSEDVGLIGMLLSLTTPWIVYVSTAGLVDSVVGLYAFFAIYAAFLFRETTKNSNHEPGPVVPTLKTRCAAKTQADRRITLKLSSGNFVFLTGFFAGCAAACKYPTMLFVVLPLAVFVAAIVMTNRIDWKSRVVPLLIFSFAVLLACGGWYVKNWWLTGNPVYPLCYSLFGDSTGTWTPEIDARWTRVHSPHEFTPSRFAADCWNVFMASPWNAPLIVPLGLLLCLAKRDREQNRIVFVLLAWLLFLFAAWWLLTHRIDRFWLAAFPVLSLLAGIGACWSDDKRWRRILTVFLLVSTLYCFLVAGAPAPGKVNHFLAPLDTIRHRTPWAAWFNTHPPEGKILLIGEAKAFLYDVPVLYNSCFNETPLKEIAEAADPAAELHRLGISCLLVDWSEIRRFRSPGNYGYSTVVSQTVFDRLVAAGILDRFAPTEELEKSPTVAYRVR